MQNNQDKFVQSFKNFIIEHVSTTVEAKLEKLDLLSTIDEGISESRKSARDSTSYKAEKQSQSVQELKQALERERSVNKQFMAEKQQLLLQLTNKEDKIYQLVADNKALLSNIEELKGIVRNRQATIDHLKAMPTVCAEPTITLHKATQWPMTTISRPHPAPISSPPTKNAPRTYAAPRQAEEAIPAVQPPSNSLKGQTQLHSIYRQLLKRNEQRRLRRF